jgi:hypothetical protein
VLDLTNRCTKSNIFGDLVKKNVIAKKMERKDHVSGEIYVFSQKT